MQPDHLGFAQLGVLGHERQIGAELASVARREAHYLWRRQLPRIERRQRALDPTPQLLTRQLHRIVLDAQGAIGGDQSQQAGYASRLQGQGQRPDLVVDGDIDRVPEFNDQTPVTRRQKPNRHCLSSIARRRDRFKVPAPDRLSLSYGSDFFLPQSQEASPPFHPPTPLALTRCPLPIDSRVRPAGYFAAPQGRGMIRILSRRHDRPAGNRQGGLSFVGYSTRYLISLGRSPRRG